MWGASAVAAGSMPLWHRQIVAEIRDAIALGRGRGNVASLRRIRMRRGVEIDIVKSCTSQRDEFNTVSC